MAKKKIELTAAKLVGRWLDEEFPVDLTEVNDRNASQIFAWDLTEDDIEYEIMVDGVTVAELHGITLRLLHPSRGICTVISLANPESLQLLAQCVIKHLHSKEWGNTMNNNKGAALMVPGPTMNIVHRSSVGYEEVCK